MDGFHAFEDLVHVVADLFWRNQRSIALMGIQHVFQVSLTVLKHHLLQYFLLLLLTVLILFLFLLLPALLLVAPDIVDVLKTHHVLTSFQLYQHLHFSPQMLCVFLSSLDRELLPRVVIHSLVDEAERPFTHDLFGL